jgi:hypothetical protein
VLLLVACHSRLELAAEKIGDGAVVAGKIVVPHPPALLFYRPILKLVVVVGPRWLSLTYFRVYVQGIRVWGVCRGATVAVSYLFQGLWPRALGSGSGIYDFWDQGQGFMIFGIRARDL